MSGLTDDRLRPEMLNPTQQAVWNAVEERIEAAPTDGIAADGRWNAHVGWQQKGFVDGMRVARLAAINALRAAASTSTEAVAAIEALRTLTSAVEHMRVPQNIAEAAMQVELTIGPALRSAQDALRALTPPTPKVTTDDPLQNDDWRVRPVDGHGWIRCNTANLMNSAMTWLSVGGSVIIEQWGTPK